MLKEKGLCHTYRGSKEYVYVNVSIIKHNEPKRYRNLKYMAGNIARIRVAKQHSNIPSLLIYFELFFILDDEVYFAKKNNKNFLCQE